MSGPYPEWSDGRREARGHNAFPMHPQPVPPPVQKATSWLLPDHSGGGARGALGGLPPQPVPPPMMFPPGYKPGGGFGNGFPPKRKPMRQAASDVSFDTSGKDPASLRSRIFIGSLNMGHEPVRREEVIELCLEYGALRGVTHFKKQGYSFVQYETAAEADMACRELNGYLWKGCMMDVHLVGAPSQQERFQQPAYPVRPKKEKAQYQKVEPATKMYEEISFDTSSKDPALMRARVFIGGIRNPVHRKDVIELFLPFGKLTAVTLLRGGTYAFVQFESAVDAVRACEELNGTNWKGNSSIDVHLAVEGRMMEQAQPRKRNGKAAEPMDWSASAPKKAKEEEEEEPPKEPLELICKVCRWSGSSLEDFVKHREAGACVELKRTGEPPSLACASCDAALPNAWRLLFHMMDEKHHKMKLVKVDGSEEALAKANEADEKGAAEWWASVEKWLEEQKNPCHEEEGEAEKKEEEGAVKEEMKENVEEGVEVKEEKEEGDEDKVEEQTVKVEEEGEEMQVLTGVTIVCRRCHLVTEDWAQYVEHEKMDCFKPRDLLEPVGLACAMCGVGFVSAWKALFHLVDFHRMKLFSPDYSKEAQTRADAHCRREKKEVEKRMKVWIEKQPPKSE